MKPRTFFLAAVVAAFGTYANATPISGIFGINGGNVTVTGSTITWSSPTNFTVGGTLTGDFLGLTGTPGTLKPLNAAQQPVGVLFTPLVGFLTFSSGPAYSFDLDYIFPGVYDNTECASAAAPGQTCTPFTASPFNLANTSATSSTAGFLLAGKVYNGAEWVGDFTGSFSSTFINNSFQDVLAQLAQQGSVTSTFSGTFIVDPVPEPGTIGMVLLGGLLIGVARWRRRSA